MENGTWVSITMEDFAGLDGGLFHSFVKKMVRDGGDLVSSFYTWVGGKENSKKA